MRTDQDYLNILLSRLEICKSYLPKFGQGNTRGLTWDDFESLYRNDAFYHWFGLDTPLMYSAHRAAGGITSIYRQIGIGCEELIRQIIQDQLNLTSAQTKWIYTVETTTGNNRALSLDARIELDDIADPLKKQRVHAWMLQASAQLNLSPAIAKALRGIVFEIRQGYKSKDSKRQNADLANAANAYAQGYLPVVIVLSTQIDRDVAYRYQLAKWLLLLGYINGNSIDSVYVFVREVLDYDLTLFFQTHQQTIKTMIFDILKTLLETHE